MRYFLAWTALVAFVGVLAWSLFAWVSYEYDDDSKPKPPEPPKPAVALNYTDYGSLGQYGDTKLRDFVAAMIYARNGAKYYTREQAHWAYVAADEFLMERKGLQ